MPQTLETALRLAEAGWYLLPIWAVDASGTCCCPLGAACAVNAGKHPQQFLVPQGLLNASCDVSTMTAWFADGTCNLAVALSPSGLMAIDVDVYKGDKERLDHLEATLGTLPETRVQRSGSGEGYHLIYQAPSFPLRGNLNDITIRGRNYIVIAPSIHKSGGTYQWVSDSPVAPLPDTWLSALKRPDTVGSIGIPETEPLWLPDEATRFLVASQWLEVQPAEVYQVSPNGHTWNVLRGFIRSYALKDADAAFIEVQRYNERCTPPWPLDRLAEKVRKVYQEAETPEWGCAFKSHETALEEIGFSNRGAVNDPSLPLTDGELLQQALIDVNAALGTNVSNPERGLLFEHAPGLFDREWPNTPWLVQGLITQGGIGAISTEPKAAKTWLGTEIAMAVATGTRVCGEYETTRQKVAYFYAEDMGQSVRNRLRALAKARDLPPGAATDYLYVQPRGRNLDLCRVADVALLVASCRKIKDVKLLVLDPLRDIHSGKENESDDMTKVMTALRVISQLVGCSVLVIHHSAKSGAENKGRRQGQKMRGSGAIHGAMDFAIYLYNLAGDGVSEFTNQCQSEVKAAKSAGYFELTLQIIDGEDGTAEKAWWCVTKQAINKERLSNGDQHEMRIRDVVDVLGVHTKPLSAREVQTRCKGRMESVLLALQDAEKRLLIEPAPGRMNGYQLTQGGRAFFANGLVSPNTVEKTKVKDTLASLDLIIPLKQQSP